jgi:hypothetical protein
MKKLAAILCLSALTTGAFAQGLVNFYNDPNTKISSGPTGSGVSLAAGAPGSYYFALLTAATASGPFTQVAYATNSAGAGRMTGGGGVSIASLTGGAPFSYEVAGWSANLGPTWKSTWLVNNQPAPINSAVWGSAPNTFFGLSPIGSGTAGGGSPPAPAWGIFAGTGLAGFNLTPVGVPEPTSMALAGLGAAALLIFRRRK